MSRHLRVLYNSLGTPELYELIRSRMGPQTTLVTLDTDEDAERREKVASCEVVIVAAKPLSPDIISAAAKLELVHHQGVGYHDTVPTEALVARGVRLALTPEGTTISVAEHAVLLALGAARRAAFADAELRRGRWHVNTLRPVSVELYGKTIGFVGFGRIGQEAARRFAAFGMTRLYVDPAVPAGTDLPARAASFEYLIQACDFLSLHVPLTDATRHLISAAVIGRMREEAILVNTARGGIVDDAALAEALTSGRLLAAGLDVFEDEPIGKGHPLCGLPNVFLTPHISAGTRDAMGHKMTALFANLARYRDGKPLRNEVCLSIGGR